jgi:hypothetical protein
MATDPLQTVIDRYQLKGTPYGKTLALNLVDEDDENLLVTEGLLDVDSQIVTPLKCALQDDRPCFFLVSGRSRTGRTTVANLILERHRALRKFRRDHFVVPDNTGSRDAGGDSPYEVYKQWIEWLLFGVEEKQATLSSKVTNEAQKELEKEKAEGYKIRFAKLFRELHTDLKKNEPSAGFSVCIEEIRKVKLIRDALRLFQRIPVAVVFTAQDYEEIGGDVVKALRNPNQEIGTKVHHIPLMPLADEVIETVAERRWNGPHPQPFAEGAFNGAFKTAPTFGLALTKLRLLLKLKAINADPTDTWPHAGTLRYTAKQVRLSLKVLEQQEEDMT